MNFNDHRRRELSRIHSLDFHLLHAYLITKNIFLMIFAFR